MSEGENCMDYVEMIQEKAFEMVRSYCVQPKIRLRLRMPSLGTM